MSNDDKLGFVHLQDWYLIWNFWSMHEQLRCWHVDAMRWYLSVWLFESFAVRDSSRNILVCKQFDVDVDAAFSLAVCVYLCIQWMNESTLCYTKNIHDKYLSFVVVILNCAENWVLIEIETRFLAHFSIAVKFTFHFGCACVCVCVKHLEMRCR